MMEKNLASMSPWQAKGECPFDCIGCDHLINVHFYSKDDVCVECDLDEDEE